MLHNIIENLKARVKAKRYDIHKQEVVKKGNDGYFIYNDTIYYGNRFFVFFYSSQNSWFQDKRFLGDKFKIGDKCYITENTAAILNLPNLEYTIVDILQDDVKYRIVVNAKEMGEDWVQFFSPYEIQLKKA